MFFIFEQTKVRKVKQVLVRDGGDKQEEGGHKEMVEGEKMVDVFCTHV
jgi:hypothetical protein